MPVAGVAREVVAEAHVVRYSLDSFPRLLGHGVKGLGVDPGRALGREVPPVVIAVQHDGCGVGGVVDAKELVDWGDGRGGGGGRRRVDNNDDSCRYFTMLLFYTIMLTIIIIMTIT